MFAISRDSLREKLKPRNSVALIAEQSTTNAVKSNHVELPTHLIPRACRLPVKNGPSLTAVHMTKEHVLCYFVERNDENKKPAPAWKSASSKKKKPAPASKPASSKKKKPAPASKPASSKKNNKKKAAAPAAKKKLSEVHENKKPTAEKKKTKKS